uniref:Uncharacterized protein n=1 Tax=Rhizophora mucronata TaxID=61149 RepID=A0A2P2IQ14_RHIMU
MWYILLRVSPIEGFLGFLLQL